METATTAQLNEWTSEFGKAYTDRHSFTAEEFDLRLRDETGIRKTELFSQILPPSRIAQGKVLEVGCNVGHQLTFLRTVNPGLEFYGVEPQEYAIRVGQELNPGVVFKQGDIFEIPYDDESFDVVMTNRVLIHIAPDDLPRAMSEIHRVSRRFIFLHEYYSPTPKEVSYRAHGSLLWKMDYRGEYMRLFPHLMCIRERYLRYRYGESDEELVDQVCLLEKR